MKSDFPDVTAWLRACHGEGATISLEQFVDAALYAPRVGYYRQARERVGYGSGRDFYTAESLGPIFTALVLDAVQSLLPGPAADYTWTEFGAERPGGLLGDRPHPFAHNHTIGFGHDWELAGAQVLFSNELFDAQPFRRFESRHGRWLEHGVRLDAEGLTGVVAEPFAALPAELPEPPFDGYRYDFPSGSGELLHQLVDAPWHGLFVAFDYGLERATLATERPHGTARTYFQHQSGDDLLADPGRRDITHHVDWDLLTSGLLGAGFTDVQVLTQESFFMHHAQRAIERIVGNATRPGVHRDLQTLKELLHPHHMGRKFQVLVGFRAENACQGSESS